MLLPIVVLIALVATHAAAANITIAGQVQDENGSPVAGARITLTPDIETESVLKESATSDPTGTFAFSAAAGVEYTLLVEREGHFIVRQRISVSDSTSQLEITLPRKHQVNESVDAAYSPASIDPDRTYTSTLVTGTNLVDVPYPKTNEIRNAMRIMPGVVQDSRGGLHVNGGTEEQALYTLDGFTINDPLTGRLESRLSVEAVRAFELRSGSLPAEYGKGASGVFAIRTEPGADKPLFTATNFVPGIEHHKGIVIGGWTPRFGVSGPIRRGKAWVSNSVDLQYTNTIVDELERGRDQSTSWRGSNLLRSQVNLTDSNILNTGLLVSFWNAGKTGLTALDPIETTVDRRARSYFFNLKDQIAFGGGGLVEFGYAASRNSAREIPQGEDVQIFTPNGLRGNHMTDARRGGGRDQFIVNTFVPAFDRAGRHQIKIGTDFNFLTYDHVIRRSGLDFLRADGTLVRATRFAGPNALHNSSREFATYIQDSWRLKPNLLIELGFRQDWDALVRDATFAPRVGFAWAPNERTKIAGGVGTVYETGNLRLYSEPLDQYSITTSFPYLDEQFRMITISRYATPVNGLRSPKYRSWSASFERQWSQQFYSRVSYLGRRGSKGLTFIPIKREERTDAVSPLEVTVLNDLTNLRNDIYDAVEIAARHTFRSQYEWMFAYTRSRALSNAVTDVRADNPILTVDNAGPMPWDSPNRTITWGYLPTGLKNWAFAYLLEWRTGHPFSIQNEQGWIEGPINGRRFPAYFELNTHLERKFTSMGYRWAFRFGVNNLTDHKNPNVVVNTLGSPLFLNFYGGQKRAFNFRIRWLGRAR